MQPQASDRAQILAQALAQARIGDERPARDEGKTKALVQAIVTAQALALRQAEVLHQAQGQALVRFKSCCVESRHLDTAQAEYRAKVQAQILSQAKALSDAVDEAIKLTRRVADILDKAQGLFLSLDKNLILSLAQALALLQADTQTQVQTLARIVDGEFIVRAKALTQALAQALDKAQALAHQAPNRWYLSSLNTPSLSLF